MAQTWLLDVVNHGTGRWCCTTGLLLSLRPAESPEAGLTQLDLTELWLTTPVLDPSSAKHKPTSFPPRPPETEGTATLFLSSWTRSDQSFRNNDLLQDRLLQKGMQFTDVFYTCKTHITVPSLPHLCCFCPLHKHESSVSPKLQTRVPHNEGWTWIHVAEEPYPKHTVYQNNHRQTLMILNPEFSTLNTSHNFLGIIYTPHPTRCSHLGALAIHSTVIPVMKNKMMDK